MSIATDYRLLRNQMVIMSTLRNLTTNDNIKNLLDDNIEPTARMLQRMESLEEEEE